MPSCNDVASYILKARGEMTAVKFQKLLYYAQAWTLVWEDRELFPEEIEAWASGPVVPSVYARHKGLFRVDSSLYTAAYLPELDVDNIDRVLAFYGDRTAHWLGALVRLERPWIEARGDIPIGEPCQSVISLASMHEYYSSLP